MEDSILSLIFLSSLVAILTTIIFLKIRTKSSQKQLPSPWKLPIIGHMHHLAGALPHRSLRKLSQKLGPIFLLQLGEIPTIMVSSPRLATEVLKTKDIVCASRAEFLVGKVMSYDFVDIVCAPYGEYWRQMRKICVLELLSAKMVRSFGGIRKSEGLSLITSIKALSAEKKPIDLTEKVKQFTTVILVKAAFGNLNKDDQSTFLELMTQVWGLANAFEISDLFPSLKILHPLLSNRKKLMKIKDTLDGICDGIIDQHMDNHATVGDDDLDLVHVLLRVQQSSDHQIPITKDHIKAIMFDMFAGGTETTATVLDWAMAELMRHPEMMEKAQKEVRATFGQKKTIEEDEIGGLIYLKYVVKEGLRLHAPGPLLVPRETREECEIDGYKIPAKTKIIINAWAIGRDSESWDDPDSFKPERFENSDKDFIGADYEFIPFGAGRRMCPGINFGLASVYLLLALLLYNFDWELPDGLTPSDLDMSETVGLSASRKQHLLLIPKLYDPSLKM